MSYLQPKVAGVHELDMKIASIVMEVNKVISV